MKHELTAYEVLEIAERMERNAASFYRRAAGTCEDAGICKLFAELAQWEKRHVQIFAEMKEALSERTWKLGRLEPDRVESSRLQMAPAVFGDHDEPSQELPAGAARADVLRMAIRKEKDSIAYYRNLTEFVLGDTNVEVIKDIIREEQKHVRILTQSLDQIV